MAKPMQVETQVFHDTPALHLELQQWLTETEEAEVRVAVVYKKERINKGNQVTRFLQELERMV